MDTRFNIRQGLYIKYFWILGPAIKVLNSCKTKEQMLICCRWISSIINQSRKYELRTHPHRYWSDIEEAFSYIFHTVLMASDNKFKEFFTWGSIEQ